MVLGRKKKVLDAIEPSTAPGTHLDEGCLGHTLSLPVSISSLSFFLAVSVRSLYLPVCPVYLLSLPFFFFLMFK